MNDWQGPKLWHHPKDYPEPAVLTPVWVRLDAICRPEPDDPRHVIEAGLNMTGQVRGLVVRWHRTVNGDWLGLVNYAVPYADGRRNKVHLKEQLVPIYALRRRTDGKRL